MSNNFIVYANKQVYYGSKMIYNSIPSLDPYTIRLKFNNNYNPNDHLSSRGGSGTWTLIDAANNIWDNTYINSSWSNKFAAGPYSSDISNNITEVIGSNLSGVTDASSMFNRGNHPANALKKVVLNKTETITNVGNMFKSCSADSVTIYDMSGVTSTGQMFMGSSVSDVHLYNTSNITSVSSMFAGCNNLITAPLFDTSGVEAFTSMFYNCSNLTTTVSYDLTSARRLTDMFYNCPSLTTVALMDTSNVTNMANMFNSCTSLTNLPSFNTGNVTTFFRMLYGCTSLATIPLFNTSSAESVESMCSGCSVLDSSAYDLYQQASTQSVPPLVTTDCFKDCGIYWYDPGVSYNYLARIPSSWGGTGA